MTSYIRVSSRELDGPVLRIESSSASARRLLAEADEESIIKSRSTVAIRLYLPIIVSGVHPFILGPLVSAIGSHRNLEKIKLS